MSHPRPFRIWILILILRTISICISRSRSKSGRLYNLPEAQCVARYIALHCMVCCPIQADRNRPVEEVVAAHEYTSTV